jgi:putative alpha-1,2-mannosidase
MYSALGYPDKAAKWIKAVVDSFYKTGPDGLIGNDDCGQMSAWYIFSSLGLYPMNPASGEYVFGFPLVKNASINLGGNKKLNIKVVQKGDNKNAYIRSVLWNGKKLDQHYIKHSKLIKGGSLTYMIE